MLAIAATKATRRNKEPLKLFNEAMEKLDG